LAPVIAVAMLISPSVIATTLELGVITTGAKVREWCLRRSDALLHKTYNKPRPAKRRALNVGRRAV